MFTESMNEAAAAADDLQQAARLVDLKTSINKLTQHSMLLVLPPYLSVDL